MNILNYIADTERRYDIRIKTLLPLDNDTLDRIERVLMRYNPLDMGHAAKTILQARPVDFPKAQNCEVHMVDVGLGLPVSGTTLRTELARAFNLSEDVFVVRTANDPLEAQGDACETNASLDAEADKKGLKRGSLLSTVSDYPEAPAIEPKDYYGDAYNGRLVSYLRTVASEAAEARKVDAPSPLFKWMDLPASDVECQTPAAEKAGKGAVPHQAPLGNLDSDSRRIARVYDGKGGRTVLSADLPGLRKGGSK